MLDVIDPSTEEAFTQIPVGGKRDVDRAVAAAKAAFPAFSQTTRAQRLDLLKAIMSEYNKRRHDIAEALSQEMGAPLKFAYERQSATGTGHLARMIEVLETYRFEKVQGTTLIAKEPIGVVGLITPWNWPINQIVCKVAPAIAAGCTMVLKPSEIAPLNAILWSEVMHAAGVPKGVYNMVQGEGGVVGAAMSAHPNIDMMSFTGSTRAGVLVAQPAATTVKRVARELGGKSANILLPDVDFQNAVKLRPGTRRVQPIKKGQTASWLRATLRAWCTAGLASCGSASHRFTPGGLPPPQPARHRPPLTWPAHAAAPASSPPPHRAAVAKPAAVQQHAASHPGRAAIPPQSGVPQRPSPAVGPHPLGPRS